MVRRREQLLGRRAFHHPAEIHDHHAVGDMLDHRQVVADEQVGQAELLAQVHEQVQHLGLDRDVERSEEHTSELQSLMRISYAVFCLKKKTRKQKKQHQTQ